MAPIPPETEAKLKTANQTYKSEKNMGLTSLTFKEWLQEKRAHKHEFHNASGAAEYYFAGDGKPETTPAPKTQVSFIGIPVKTILVATLIVTTVIILTQIVKRANA